MADGDFVNSKMKEYLKSVGATDKATRKSGADIVAAVLVSANATDANRVLVTRAVRILLDDYSRMVALGQAAAIRTASDVSGFWLDLNSPNANAFTDFACGLSATRSLVESMVARMAPVPPSPTVAPTPESVSFEESIPVMTELVIPQAPAMPNDCCEALKSALYLYEKKILTLEHFLETIRAIPQRCCA